MAVTSKRVVVSTTPVMLALADDGWVHLSALYWNVSFVLLGGADISLENGVLVQLSPYPFSLQLKAQDNLWAMARSPLETTIVGVLQHKKV